jgi:antitoxin FitA
LKGAIIAIIRRWSMATNLIVRNVDAEIVKLLKQKAARNGRSAEAEHRAILEAALRRPRKRSFYEVLASMPNVGEDSDFEFRRE